MRSGQRLPCRMRCTPYARQRGAVQGNSVLTLQLRWARASLDEPRKGHLQPRLSNIPLTLGTAQSILHMQHVPCRDAASTLKTAALNISPAAHQYADPLTSAAMVLSPQTECSVLVQADAMTLSTVVLLQHVVKAAEKQRRRPLHVVGMVRRQETVDVCNYIVGAGLPSLNCNVSPD